MGKTKPDDAMILGKWQLKESDNFENFMAAVGVSYLVRKLGNQSKPLVTITKDDSSSTYTFKQESLVSTTSMSFKIGEQFDEKTADGRQVKNTTTKVRQCCMSYYCCYFAGQVNHDVGEAERSQARDAGDQRRQGLGLRQGVLQRQHEMRLHRRRHCHDQNVRPRSIAVS